MAISPNRLPFVSVDLQQDLGKMLQILIQDMKDAVKLNKDSASINLLLNVFLYLNYMFAYIDFQIP